jgi:hypothetical protein
VDKAEIINANWRALSLKVLTPILVDPGAAFPVVDVIGHNVQWFEHQYRSIYQYTLACVENDVPPTPPNISARSGGTVSVDEIDALSAMWNDLDSRDLIGNTNALKALGVMFELRDIGDVLGGITDPEEVMELISYAETALSGAMANKVHRDSSATAVSESAHEVKDVDIIPTGIDWFDDLAGGTWTGMITWIAARYKGGKSTLMRMMVMAACEAGYPVEIFAAEGSREMFAIDTQVMLAVRYMLEKGTLYTDIRLSALLVNRARIQPDRVQLTDIEKEALAYARREFESWPILVRDAVDDINSLINVAYKVKQGKMDQGTKIIFLDFAGLFNLPNVSGIYESATAVAVFLQKLAAKERISVVVVAQKNEQGVKTTGKESYSAQISGGGAAPATADFLFQPNIKSVGTGLLNVMRLALTHSRHVPTFSGAHVLHPSSGLFIDDYVNLSRENIMALLEADEPGDTDGNYFPGFGGGYD